jgi:hypothetical protein
MNKVPFRPDEGGTKDGQGTIQRHSSTTLAKQRHAQSMNPIIL